VRPAGEALSDTARYGARATEAGGCGVQLGGGRRRGKTHLVDNCRRMSAWGGRRGTGSERLRGCRERRVAGRRRPTGARGLAPHRLDFGAEGELADAAVLMIVPDHHLGTARLTTVSACWSGSWPHGRTTAPLDERRPHAPCWSGISASALHPPAPRCCTGRASRRSQSRQDQNLQAGTRGTRA